VRPHERIELDLSPLEDKEALLKKCRSYEDPEKIVEFVLKGAPSFTASKEELLRELEESFFYISITDESSHIDLALLEKLADEHTVRGKFVKRIMAVMAEAKDPREKEVLKLALLKGLAAFKRSE